MENYKKQSFYKKVIAFLSSVGFITAAFGVSVTLGALTFSATEIQSDGTLVIDSTSTMSVGASSATTITIGRSGQVVQFRGSISSSIIDISSTISIGTASATIITIGRATTTVSFPGVVSSSRIDGSGEMTIGTSTATAINIGRSGQYVRFLGNVSTTGSFTFSATGTPVLQNLSVTSSIDFEVLDGPICSSTPFSLAGAVVGDIAMASPLATLPVTGIEAFSSTSWSAYVSSSDIVAVRVCFNNVSSSIDIGAQIWRVSVWKY